MRPCDEETLMAADQLEDAIGRMITKATDFEREHRFRSVSVEFIQSLHRNAKIVANNVARLIAERDKLQATIENERDDNEDSPNDA